MINWSHSHCSWLYLQTSRNAYRTYPAEIFEKITTWLLLINKSSIIQSLFEMHFMIFLSKFFTIPWIPLRIVELCPRAMISHTLVIVYRVNFLLLIPCSKICPDTNWFLWTLVKMTLFSPVSHSFFLFSVLIILCISTI